MPLRRAIVSVLSLGLCLPAVARANARAQIAQDFPKETSGNSAGKPQNTQAPASDVVRPAPPVLFSPARPSRLLRYSGELRDAAGQPRTGTVALTFSIYAGQQGGAELWTETQSVALDAEGRYSVLLGSTKSEGMPLGLFATGAPRWLAVKVELPGEVEQTRVLLVSVPYALKASDADTLGGKPASSYAMASSGAGAGGTQTGKKPATTNTETEGFIPMFTNSSGALGNSLIEQVGTAIGIGESPVQTLDVNGGIRASTGLATGSRNTSADAINTNALFLNGSNAMGVIGTSNAVFAPGVLFTTVSFYGGNGTTTSERMTLNGTTGNIGIGTVTPGGSLTVAGNMQLTGTGSSILFPDGTLRTSANSISVPLSVSPPSNLASGTSSQVVTGTGIFLQSANGSSCGLLVVSNSSALTLNSATCPTAVPVVQLSAELLNFPAVLVNTASSAMTVTVTNVGTASLSFSANPSISGPSAADFSTSTSTTPCSTSSAVTAGSNCSVNLIFTPSHSTVELATLTLTDNATPSTQLVQLVSAPGIHWVGLSGTNSTTAGVTYNVYRGTSSGGEGTTPIFTCTTLEASPTTCMDTNMGAGLVAGVTYYYTVTAVLNTVPSAPSNEAMATIPIP